MSSLPRILYLTHRVPHPPNRGDRIRSYHTLRFLAEHARVDLACLADEPVAESSREVLDRLCERVAIEPIGGPLRWGRAVGSWLRGRSATERLFYSPALYRTLCQWSGETQYDAVLAFCSSMAPYLDAGQLPATRAFVDLVDVDSQKWFDYSAKATPPASWLFRHEGRRVRDLELSLANRCQAMFVVSADEAKLLASTSSTNNVFAVPNGVDAEYFQPAPELESPTPECVFVGALDYRANIDGVVWFCQHVWPLVRASYPVAKLKLVGRCPADAVQQLAGRDGVEVFANVPDVRPYLHSAQVVVAPLRIARGIQNKVLEAMAAGKPVVASPDALVGIAATIGEHLHRADGPDQWRLILGSLFEDSEQRRQLGAAATTFVRARHNWPQCLAPLAAHLGFSAAPGRRGAHDVRAFQQQQPEIAARI